MDQVEDSKNNNEDGNDDLVHFGVLRERVNNIDKRLGELVEGMGVLNNTIHEASRTKWGELAGIATVICMIFGGLWLLVIIPLKDDIKTLQVGTMTAKEEAAREFYVDRELLRLEGDMKDKAAKDDLNRLIIEIDKRLPQLREK